MFTEGLDESAISWIKKGSDVEQCQNRSPLTEKIEKIYPLPRSPLPYSPNNYKSSNFLPPLKFHSGLLKPLNTVSLSVDSNEDASEYENGDHETDHESVGSATDEICENYSNEDAAERLGLESCNEDFMEVNSRKQFNGTKCGSAINRGFLMEDLRIEVPVGVRRFTDGARGSRGLGQNGALSVGTCRLDGKSQPHSAYGTPAGKLSDMMDLGTPSAPPLMGIGKEAYEYNAGGGNIVDSIESKQEFSGDNMVFSAQCEKLVEAKEEGKRIGEETLGERDSWHLKSVKHAPHYDASGQNAWQALVAYDACIRLCLNSWARGCAEAPEFLRDECLLLRNAFGLHKLLLQPRGAQPIERTNKTTEKAITSKVKSIIGKVRVEVKKLRIVPRRQLKSTNSMRAVMYLQAGADYVRHVSSMVKQGINSLKSSSFSLPPEESLLCLVRLKSLDGENEADTGSSILLKAGTGEYHDFFPESQGDTLSLEIQDAMRNVQGYATIPLSSLSENLNDRIRWWPIHHNDHECVGKVLLSTTCTFTSDEELLKKGGSIVETLAYDLLLEAAMRADQFHARNLRIEGPWKWILAEFADYYGVSDTYSKLRYLSYVMNISTPTKDCLELVYELLVPVMKARNERSLTRQEKSILLDCETQVERLLAEVFQNYKSLDENSPTGLADMSTQIPEEAAPSLAPAVKVYTLLHDILSQDAQTTLKSYLQAAAAKRCRKHMLETDEFLSSNSEDFIMDAEVICKAYLRMKNLCTNICNEIRIDIKIHDQHIFPSSIDLSSITSAVYSKELCTRLRAFLAAWPPSSPMPHVNELLIAISDFERSLELWNISPIQGGVDSRELYHNYIMVWIEDLQLTLLDLCKAEKVPWSGVFTKYSTSPFAEEMFEKMARMIDEYEVVINRWPQYTLILENESFKFRERTT